MRVNQRQVRVWHLRALAGIRNQRRIRVNQRQVRVWHLRVFFGVYTPQKRTYLRQRVDSYRDREVDPTAEYL